MEPKLLVPTISICFLILHVLGDPVVTFGDSLGLFSLPTTLLAFGGPGVNISDLAIPPGDLLVPFQNSSFDLNFAPLPVGSVFLASLVFSPLAQGSGDIAAIPGFFSVGDLTLLLDIDPAQELISISPIPLPGALWLMISGLMGIGVMARKRGSAN